MADVTDNTPYELKRRGIRRSALAKAADQAEWDVPEGRIGGLVRQLRRRARLAERRAMLFLWLLAITIITALGLYLGPPLFDIGERVVFRAQIATLTDQLRTMDAAKAELRARLNTLLSFAATPVPSGTDNFLSDLSILPDGKTLVAVGQFGVITRSTNAGED